jgi:hypothetical protein
VRFLLAQNGRRASELEEALADKEGEARAEKLLLAKALAEAETNRKQRANHSTEPTPTSGTSAAEHPPRQP